MGEKYGVGKVFTTKEGYKIEIIEKIKRDVRRIIFLDEGRYSNIFSITTISDGGIRNPYHKSVCGIGYLGNRNNKINLDGKISNEYKTWSSMLNICYKNVKFSYKGCTVCEEWLNFSNFHKWYDDNFPKHISDINFQLDKDVLQDGIKNKIYSPTTCIFLPSSINNFLTNNKVKTNTSGCVGVHWDNLSNKWISQISDFETKKRICLIKTDDINIASSYYQQARAINSEKVKDYLRSLNYLSEEIIQLIK